MATKEELLKRIALEPSVYEALIRYANSLKQARNEA